MVQESVTFLNPCKVTHVLNHVNTCSGPDQSGAWSESHDVPQQNHTKF